MSTRKSRQLRGSNVLTSEEFQNLANSDDEDQDNRTAKQKRIDKKLSESGFEDVNGLSWDEKEAIYNSLNASVSTADYEKRVRSSPRVSGLKKLEDKSLSQKTKEQLISIEVENSNGANSDEGNKNSNQSASNNNVKKTTSINPFIAAFNTVKNVVNVLVKSDTSETAKSEAAEKINDQKLFSDSESDNFKNSTKKGGLGAGDEKTTIDLSSDEDSEKLFQPSKKRPSPPEAVRFDSVKRLKMDRPIVQVNKPKPKRTPLKTEIEIAKRQLSVPFKRRSVRTILNELETANRMYKEASVKYRFPVRWGEPTVKNCEKWDSHNIPKKLIDRYHKYLTNNDMDHSAFKPVHEILTSAVVEPLRNYETIENDDDDDIFQVNTKSKTKDEFNLEFELGERKTEMKAILDNVRQENVKNTPKQGDFKRTRGRNQQKKIDLFDDDNENDNIDSGSQEQDSEEWLPKNEKGKSKRNGRSSKHGKNSVKLDLNRHPFKAEKSDTEYKFFKSKNEEVPEKGNKAKKDDVIHISQESENSQEYAQEKEVQTEGSDNELVDCPICNNKFKKDSIENHAQECATKTFQD